MYALFFDEVHILVFAHPRRTSKKLAAATSSGTSAASAVSSPTVSSPAVAGPETSGNAPQQTDPFFRYRVARIERPDGFCGLGVFVREGYLDPGLRF